MYHSYCPESLLNLSASVFNSAAKCFAWIVIQFLIAKFQMFLAIISKVFILPLENSQRRRLSRSRTVFVQFCFLLNARNSLKSIIPPATLWRSMIGLQSASPSIPGPCLPFRLLCPPSLSCPRHLLLFALHFGPSV